MKSEEQYTCVEFNVAVNRVPSALAACNTCVLNSMRDCGDKVINKAGEFVDCFDKNSDGDVDTFYVFMLKNN